MLLFIDLFAFYGPLWFLITLIIFLIIQFFSERKYPIGIIKPPSIVYFQTFTYLFITLIYYFNYEYYSAFFSSSIKIQLAKILLINLLVLIIGIVFVFLNHKRNIFIISFMVFLSISVIFPNVLNLSEPRLERQGNRVSYPVKIPDTKLIRKLKIVLMNGISFNLIKTLQKEQKLENFDLLFQKGVRGTFTTYNPNLDLALLNSALTGLKPSKFKEHSDLKFKFNDLKDKFDIFPRYLFFRYSSILGSTTLFKFKNKSNINNSIKQNYEQYGKKTDQLIYPDHVPIYFEKSLPYNDDFVQKFNDTLKMSGRKPDILKKAFFYDNYVRQLMKLNDEELYYSITRFPGISIINRYFLQYIYPVYGNISESEIKNYKWIIQKYYKYYDDIIGNLISTTRDNELLVIISFYEYEPLPAWRRVLLNLFGEKDVYVYKDLNSKGTIFFLENEALKKDYPLKNISIFDIYPTLLYYTGFPISKKLEGEIVREMFTEDFILNNHINIDTAD